MSKHLQKVEQFPWEVQRTQIEIITKLREMQNIKLTNDKDEKLEKTTIRNCGQLLTASSKEHTRASKQKYFNLSEEEE